MGEYVRPGSPPEKEKRSYLGISALVVLALFAIAVILVIRTNAAKDPTPPAPVAPQTPYAARIAALERLNASFPTSLTKNLSFRARLAGEDTLVFESPVVNLEEGMVDFIHRGQGAYKDIWPGGIKAFAASNGFSKVVYRSLPNGATWTLN